MDGELSGADRALIDARAEGMGRADLILVFGTRLTEPARLAAEAFHRGVAPWVVVTGGADRQDDGRNEAQHHRAILVAAGVPDSAILVEARSTHTIENVELALPLIRQVTDAPTTVVAVVKQFHRRALVTLARLVPSIERIYVLSYEPALAPDDDRLRREVAYLRRLAQDGVDLLVATDAGWVRTPAT